MLKDFTTFLGLKTSETTPPPNSAQSCSNVVLDRIRGSIQNTLGYSKLYDLPVPTSDEKSTSLSWMNCHKIYVPNHGGRYVTLAMGKYTKGDYFDGNSPVNRWGVWARPYWANLLDNNNSTLETDSGNWTAYGNHSANQSSSYKRNGSYSLKISSTGIGDFQNNYATLDLTDLPNGWLTVGQTYVLRMYGLFHIGGNMSLSIAGNTFSTFSLPGGSTVFTEYSVEFTAKTLDPLKITLNGLIPQELYLDDVEILGWVDAWQELSEMQTVKAVAVSAGTVQIDDGSLALPQSYFTNQRMKDWVVMYVGAGQYSQGHVVSALRTSGSSVYLDLQSFDPANSHIAAGSKLFIFRNLALESALEFGAYNNYYPSDPSIAYFDTVGNEARLTVGNGAYDFPVMIGFGQWRYGWNTASQTVGVVDRLYMEQSCAEGHKWTLRKDSSGTAADSGSLPVGTYLLAVSIIYQDGQEGQLYTSFDSIVIGAGSLKAQWKIDVNVGTLPRRAKLLRMYVKKDTGLYYYIKDVDLSSYSSWTLAIDTVTTRALYYVSDLIDVAQADWDARGADLETQRGRAVSNTGVIRYLRARSSGATRFAYGCVVDGVPTPNKVYMSNQSGDGVNLWDAFPADGNTTLDIEYSDGDEVLECGPQAERILVFKNHSVALLLPDNVGGYSRDLLGANIGMCSPESLVNFEDSWVWADYNGIYSFGASGLKLLNGDWLNDWRSLSQSQKEATRAIVDRDLRKIRFYINGLTYVYSFDDSQWLNESVETPQGYVRGVDFNVDYFDQSSIYRIGGSNLLNGAALAVSFKTNNVLLQEGEVFDILIDRLSIQKNGTTPVTVGVYLDDAVTASFSQVLAPFETTSTIKAPLFTLCKKFCLSFMASMGQESDSMEIKRVSMYYDAMPSGS